MNRAVAVIFGTALGKISTPLVNDMLTPPVGLLLCGVALQRAAHHAGFRRSIDTSPSPSRRRCHAQLRSLPQRCRPLAAMIAAMCAVVRQVNLPKQGNETPDELTLVAVTKNCPYCVSVIPAAAPRWPSCTSKLTNDHET